MSESELRPAAMNSLNKLSSNSLSGYSQGGCRWAISSARDLEADKTDSEKIKHAHRKIRERAGMMISAKIREILIESTLDFIIE